MRSASARLWRRCCCGPGKPSSGPLRRFFDCFNRLFGRATDGYVRVSAVLIHKSGVAVVALLVFGVAAVFFGTKLPSGFLPDEDQGYVFVNLQLPVAASLQRTDQAAKKSRTFWRRRRASNTRPASSASAC